MVHAVCVFCGSSTGTQRVFSDAARELGTRIAQRGWRVVYGGGSIGLMGVLADAALAAGGEVVGVLPGALFTTEVAHPGLTDLRSVGSMHERKALMTELVDAFIALPGGFGTFDELFEATTWAQLRIHRKPIAILDVANYFTPFRDLVARAVADGFIRPEHAALLSYFTDVDALLDHLSAHALQP
ncbi:MAG: TIGR00730 family Rossman fold protein [Candidatus Eremiobacteraeota bacterium]|nr:TIGR00730 family Rossman fold protein [Candidatus Eremiobacteraeota bacterium]MBV9646617.1 TIGR00730 family Rossman fold protein [Candidatus Eremiobacteraeota bacterium]